MMKRFLAVTREPLFSPGKEAADTAILLETAAHLRDAGYDVEVHAGECDWWPEPRPGATVITMAQGDSSLTRLRQWAAQGVRILNRPEGISNCQRHRTIPLLLRGGIAFPDTVIVATGNGLDVPAWADDGAWVKRGDVHATQPEDVQRVKDADEARRVLRQFAERGIKQAAVQKHLPGVVVKFYAVRGHFFHVVAPDKAPALNPETLARIDALGQRAAAVLGVEIYGGDAVVATDGEVALIDLNDWPSYSPCRTAAARAIADYIREVH